MAYVCEKCNRGRLFGHRVSHAKNHTPKYSKPNLHLVSFGKGQKAMRLCTTCLRSMRELTTS